MSREPERVEIDHHTLKLIVGVIAICLATLTSLFASHPLASISASYHEGGASRDIFVGSLLAIAAFLTAYNGRSTLELVLSRVAAVAAVGVAMFPCVCTDHVAVVPFVHGSSAAVMFGVLVVFCWVFYRRARAKGHSQARVRAFLYAACGVVIVASMAVIALDNLLGHSLSARSDRLTFFAEAAGLTAFGVAWLVASCVLPLLTSAQERHPLYPFAGDGE